MIVVTSVLKELFLFVFPFFVGLIIVIYLFIDEDAFVCGAENGAYHKKCGIYAFFPVFRLLSQWSYLEYLCSHSIWPLHPCNFIYSSLSLSPCMILSKETNVTFASVMLFSVFFFFFVRALHKQGTNRAEKLLQWRLKFEKYYIHSQVLHIFNLVIKIIIKF